MTTVAAAEARRPRRRDHARRRLAAPARRATIARRLVDSNLVGHDSHGVLARRQVPRMGHAMARSGPIRAPTDRVRQRHDRDRRRQPRLRSGHGRVRRRSSASRRRAQKGIAMIGLRNCGHLGRLGDWADMAAEAGQVSLHFLNTSGAQRVAPFGGSDRRLSTNPIAIGVPLAGGDPAILDITTSTVAEGKLMVALNKGERVPEGWIVDKRRQADHRSQGFLRRRRAAHDRRAQGLGAVDPHRSPRGRGDHREELGSRRHDPAQQHAVDLHRARRVRWRAAASLAKRGASSIT